MAPKCDMVVKNLISSYLIYFWIPSREQYFYNMSEICVMSGYTALKIGKIDTVFVDHFASG